MSSLLLWQPGLWTLKWINGEVIICDIIITYTDSLAPKMKIKKFSVLKSPFIYKKHWAQYEIRTHSRILPVSLSVGMYVCTYFIFQINRITGRTADIFLEYIQRNLPEGVNMIVQKVSRICIITKELLLLVLTGTFGDVTKIIS